jgi:hypothetical protein
VVNSIGLYFSPANIKTMAFKTTIQSKFRLLEMVKYYKYIGFTIDRRLSFIRHVTDAKPKVDSRFHMIKAITNPKIGVNAKMPITLYKSLIQSVLLLACKSALRTLERKQRVPIRYFLGIANDSSSMMLYRESGMMPIHILIKDETATHIS